RSGKLALSTSFALLIGRGLLCYIRLDRNLTGCSSPAARCYAPNLAVGSFRPDDGSSPTTPSIEHAGVSDMTLAKVLIGLLVRIGASSAISLIVQWRADAAARVATMRAQEAHARAIGR